MGGFEQADADGDRDIEVGDSPGHRQAAEHIAVLPRQLAQTAFLAAQHQGHAAGRQLQLAELLLCLCFGSDQPQARLFERRQAARRLAVATSGVLSAAPLAALQHRGDSGARAAARHDHGARASGVGAAQASTQIVGVEHPVQHQQQGGSALGQQRRQPGVVAHRWWRTAGGHPLVAAVPQQ